MADTVITNVSGGIEYHADIPHKRMQQRFREDKARYGDPIHTKSGELTDIYEFRHVTYTIFLMAVERSEYLEQESEYAHQDVWQVQHCIIPPKR